MRIFLICAGESMLSPRNVCHDPEAGLSVQGQAQAAGLRNILQTEFIPVIFSSPDPAAMETAHILALGSSAAIERIDDFQELRLGIAADLSETEQKKLYPKIYQSLIEDISNPEWHIGFPGGESKQDALERFKRGLQEVFNLAKTYENAAVVSHPLLLRLWAFDQMQNSLWWEACSFRVITI